MRLENPWVGYLQRSYRQIKQSLIQKLSVNVPEITDHTESHILIVILSMMAGLTEQLNYYIDDRARESFLSTARRFNSVYKLTRILDYRIKSFLPASVDLFFTYVDDDGAPVITTQEGIIPSGTVITTLNGIEFITIKTVSIPAGASYGIAPAKQQSKRENITFGTTSILPNQSYIIPEAYAHNSIELFVDNAPWFLQTTLARSLPTDKHYIVDVDENQIPNIVFGNGINGMIPPSNKLITGDYFTTLGAIGNQVNAGTINVRVSALVLPTPATGVIITNPLEPIGGADSENIEQIRVNAPLTIRTLLRAVTKQDFKDLLMLADGVAKGDIVYNCGIKVNAYIAPMGGGVATTTLLEDTKDYIDSLKIIGREVIPWAAGVTPVVVKATVKVRFRADKIQTRIDVEQAVGDRFSFNNQDINGRVALSDITALIDNLPRVDTVTIDALYTLPYPFPIKHLAPLSWERETLSDSNERAVWRLIYTGTNFRVLYNTTNIATVNINEEYTDPKGLIKFKILPGTYTLGNTWEFTSYPYLKTLNIDDNTIPVIIAGSTTLLTVID